MAALQGSLTGVATGLTGDVSYHGLLARLDAVHGGASIRQDAVAKLDVCKFAVSDLR